MSNFNTLAKAGLLNLEIGSLGDLCMAERPKLFAYCSSYDCNYRSKKLIYTFAQNIRIRPSDKVIKDVPIRTQDCPDCGYALFWASNKERAR